MDWLVGSTLHGLHQQFVVSSRDGQGAIVDASSLARNGLPQPSETSRLVVTGELGTWSRTNGEKYLRALRIKLPVDQSNAHTVFVHQFSEKICIHVPALAIIRGFFKPHRLLFPALFRPASIGLLGFVDYSLDPPQVVLDSNPRKFGKLADEDSFGEPLRWAHTSHSSRKCAQSIHAYSSTGRIDLDLPKGEFRLVMHGLKKGRNLFVTKLTVISVKVAADDSISGQDENFTFHRMASEDRKATALSEFPQIPLRDGAQAELSDSEWQEIEGLLLGKAKTAQRYSRRLLLDIILEKLTSKRSWEAIAKSSGIPEFFLTTTFRRWDLDGRFEKVLEALAGMRSGSSSTTVGLRG